MRVRPSKLPNLMGTALVFMLYSCEQNAPRLLAPSNASSTYFATTEPGGVLLEGADADECLAYTHYEAKNLCPAFLGALTVFMQTDPLLRPIYRTSSMFAQAMSDAFNKPMRQLVMFGEHPAQRTEWTFSCPLVDGADTLSFDTFLHRENDDPCTPDQQSTVLASHFANPVRDKLLSFIRTRLVFLCGTETVLLCRSAQRARYN